MGKLAWIAPGLWYTLVLGEEGLASKSLTAEGDYTREGVCYAALTLEHRFIFLLGAQGFAIPKSQFPYHSGGQGALAIPFRKVRLWARPRRTCWMPSR